MGLADPIITEGPSLGNFVDGVFVSRAQGPLLSVSETARVEVRRGPAGTMTGRNNNGSAINFVTRKPDFKFGGTGSLKVGNYDLLESKFSVNVPLVPERLAARFAVSTTQRDGYTRNRFVGGDSTAGRDRQVAGRAQFLWNATDTLEVLFSADGSIEPRTSVVPKCKFVGFGAAPRPGIVPGPTSAGRRLAVVSTTQGLPTPTTVAERDALIATANMAAASGGRFADECKKDAQRDNFEVFADSPLDDDATNLGSTLIATWTPSETLSLKSTSSYRAIDSETFRESDATKFALQGSFRGTRAPTSMDQYSQEFTLSGQAFGNRLNWTAGVFGIVENLKNKTRAQSFADTDKKQAFIVSEGTNAEINQRKMLAVTLDPNLMSDPNFTTPLPVSGFALTTGSGECVRVPGDNVADLAVTCLRPFQSTNTENVIRLDSLNYAAYIESNFAATEKLTISGGVKLVQERKRVRRFGAVSRFKSFSQQMDPNTQPFGLDGNPDNGGRFVTALLFPVEGVFTNFEFSNRYSFFTPRLSVQYRFNDAMDGYVTWSRGFESARFNGQLFVNPAMDAFIDPEMITQYEAGFRSRWLGGRVGFNIAAYTRRFKNVQRSVTTIDANGSLTTLQQSSGQVVINGGKLDLNVVPLPNLMLSSSVTYNNGRYTVFETPPGGVSFKDARQPGLIPIAMDFVAAYSLPVGTVGDLRTRVNWRHEGKRGTIVADPDYTRVGKHGILGGRMSLDFKDGVTSLALFGNNLLDREYFVQASDFSGSNGSAQYFFAPPRTYGLELIRKF